MNPPKPDRKLTRNVLKEQKTAKKDAKQFFNNLLKEAQEIENGLKRTVNSLPFFRRWWIAQRIIWGRWK